MKEFPPASWGRREDEIVSGGVARLDATPFNGQEGDLGGDSPDCAICLWDDAVNCDVTARRGILLAHLRELLSMILDSLGE